MQTVNINSTNDLLKGLGEHVSIENLDQYLQTQGVVVDVSIGRMRIPISLDPAIYGIDVNSNEDLNAFFSEHVKKSKLIFISKKYEKKLQSIESAVRLKRNDMAIGYDNKYMPIETYKEFKLYFQEKKREYFIIMNEIADNWNVMCKRFAEQLDYVFQELNSIDKEKIKAQIWKKIPSVDDYKRSFYMEAQLRAFPVMGNVSLLDEDISEAIKERAIEDNINSVYDILITTLKEGFLKISTVCSYYYKNDNLTAIQGKQLAILKENLKRNNLLKNGLIDEIIEDLNVVENNPNTDEKIELLEFIIIKIYKFAVDIGKVENLPLDKCPIEVEDLDNYANNLV